MALRSAVTRLLTTSQRSVAVAASRAQGTAAAASRGAFKTRRLTIKDSYSKPVRMIYQQLFREQGSRGDSHVILYLNVQRGAHCFHFIPTDGEETQKQGKTG